SATLSGFGSRVAAQGTLAVVLSYNSTNNYLDIIDASNPFVPVRKASPVVGVPGTGKSVTLVNGLAYVAANSQGLALYDVTNPPAPVLRNTVPTIGDALGVALTGGYAYVADYPATVDSINLGQ